MLDETEGSFKAEKYPEFRLAQEKPIPELIVSEMVQFTRPTCYQYNYHSYDVPHILNTRILKDGDLFMPLLIEITKLGRELIKNDKGADVARSLNNEGARPLAKVRDALRLIVPLHEDFMKYVLQPQNFGIISKTINFRDIVHACHGDNIEAEIARVKCLEELITYPDARKLMNNDLIRPLLQVHQAFNEELGSGQWLKRQPEYSTKLQETLEKFVLNADGEDLETFDKDVQRKLEQFSPAQDQEGRELHGGWLSKFLFLLLNMNEELGINLNRICT
ncbi:hypothetical protein IW261DRAFT_1422007 [Armillaria novae-zelandiae]|uniref:Uncharacterized protein n=1 Tax=Armillaria novae-zelandiae TaxID=153914 RepID=A0AA39P215_9AGAR|nr:hypothetical protein IW261DRAFT_1422007 [Armillaria novae-zelandiae]